MKSCPLQRKLFATANQLGLTRAERHELAEMILRRDIATWADLDEAQMGRLLDSLEGFAAVRWIYQMRETVPLEMIEGRSLTEPTVAGGTVMWAEG